MSTRTADHDPEWRRGAAVGVLTFLLAAPCLGAAPGEPSPEAQLYFGMTALLGGSLVLPLDGELEATVYLNNRSDEERYVRGEVADEQGRLVLSGDWELFVDELRLGEAIATKPIEVTGLPEAAEPWTLGARESKHWKVRLPVASLVDHAGNYRLRVRLGSLEDQGHLLRVAESLETPDWISLSYTPDKTGYRLGEPIAVHFVIQNQGEDSFPFIFGGDYRGATRHLRFAFRATNENGEEATDPSPGQSCMGGIGTGEWSLEPGERYESDLPLLAYLAFPSPGIWKVTAYQSLGFGVPVEGLEEAGWAGYAYGGTFEVEIVAPEPGEAVERVHSLLAIEDEHERRRALSFLNHPRYLEPLRAAVDDESAPVADVVGAIGELFTAEATRTLLELARHRRAEVRIASLRELTERCPEPESRRPDRSLTLHHSESRRQAVSELWEEIDRGELWSVFTAALGASRPVEAALAGRGLLARGDRGDAERLARAADRLAPRLPLDREQRDAVSMLADTAFSFAYYFGAPPVAVDASSSPGRLVVWANMLRPSETRLGPDGEALLLRMTRLADPAVRRAAIRWLPEGFSRADEIPWRELFLDEDRQIWWHAVQTAKRAPGQDLELLVRELIESSEDQEKRNDLEELLAFLEGKEHP